VLGAVAGGSIIVVLFEGGLMIVVSLSGNGFAGGFTIVVLLGAGFAGAINMKYAINKAATITSNVTTIAVVEYALASSPLVIFSSPKSVDVTPRRRARVTLRRDKQTCYKNHML
jgi:hypothetical protein